MAAIDKTGLRRGWTTGSCATAAATAALEALLGGAFPDPVGIVLPGGRAASFALAEETLGPGFARAGVVKDAGDDPDVTHGAVIAATVRLASAGAGLTFLAGPGVGTVTRPGLALAPGEPAINPVPRAMMAANMQAVADRHGVALDATVTISVAGGEALAERTLNGRLGIVGGLSILGTTGVVVPYSCAAWIDTIHRGIDVARALALPHVAGATGATSEAAVQQRYALPDPALIDMGDFAGGMLKYLRRHPVERVTVAGGVAKLTKLGQGLLDLHSGRGEVDRGWLAARSAMAGGSDALASRIGAVNTAAEAFALCEAEGVSLGSSVAEAAWSTASAALGPGMRLGVLMVDRTGRIVAEIAPRATERG